MSKNHSLAIFVVSLLLISIACGVSFDSGEKTIDAETEVEQTLQALYVQYTQEALAGLSSSPPESSAEVPAASIPTEIVHTTIPGSPGSPKLVKDEIDTSNTAADRISLGDSFRLGNFERPFTSDVMDYKQENDLLELSMAEDDDFYYFSLEIVGPDESGVLSAAYGIEFDTDLDGRGDVLLWAKGGDHPEWTIDDVIVLEDTNNDVGGSRPVLPDNDEGNGYDKVLFSKEGLDDPDAAWQRIDPGDASTIQLAIKKGMAGGSRFFWKAWADSGLADPVKFDYNDSFTEEQAGSPNKNSALYPIDQLFLMDSTCWIAYNYTATGKELGGCYQLQPTSVPPTAKPPTPVPCPPCSYWISQSCCANCGNHWEWDGTGCAQVPW